jgi:beta-1,4-mannosyl-glycoprotein beta-1,4-N-acetylglucosaminyltransferase
MKIYDCCMFFDEEMLLGLRLKTLNKYVDKFIIVESKYTHSGDKKKLIFDINKYTEFKNKINYIVIEDPPEDIEDINNDDDENQKNIKHIMNALRRENYQRNKINDGLKDAAPEDWIIISDLDEIPNLDEINFNTINKKIIFFKQRVFYYKLNLELKNIHWIGSKAVQKKNLISPQWLRNIKDRIYPKWRLDIIFSKKKYNNIFYVYAGGWHFSYVKKPEDIEKKLKSYLHHREYDLEPLGIEKIKNFVNNKSVIYDHRVDQTQYKFSGTQKLEKIKLNTLPPDIENNINFYILNINNHIILY